jgi:hypothetical protein
MKQVNTLKNSVFSAVAIIGACALLYGAWSIYQRYDAEEQRRTFFSTAPAPKTPNFLNAKPEPPPRPGPH